MITTDELKVQLAEHAKAVKDLVRRLPIWTPCKTCCSLT